MKVVFSFLLITIILGCNAEWKGKDPNIRLKDEEYEGEISDIFLDDFNPKLDVSDFFQQNLAKKQIDEDVRLKKIKKLIENGTPVDTILNVDGASPLFYASKFGYFEIVKLLVEKGADVNYKYYSETPLTIALMNCNYKIHRNIIEFLVNKGARKDIKIQGMTPSEFLIDKSNSGTKDCLDVLYLFSN